MNHSDVFLRKAAILIAALDEPVADALLDQLQRQQAAQLQGMLPTLCPLDASEQEQVVREFLQSAKHPPGTLAEADGVEVDESLARRIAAKPLPEPVVASESRIAAEDLPFGFLAGETPESLAALLGEEHPQTISLVLSHLPPGAAHGVLQVLPAASRAEILQRLANLAQTDERLVAEVERELQRAVARRTRMPRQSPVGRQVVRALLDAADAPDRELREGHPGASDAEPAPWRDAGYAFSNGGGTYGSDLTAESAEPDDEPAPGADPEWIDLAQGLAHPGDAGLSLDRRQSPPAPVDGPRDRWEFQDLVRLDDDALARVLRAVDPQVILLALAGAPAALIERILKPASSRESRAWRAQWKRLGPLRLSDIECAQRQMTDAAQRLAAQGRITPIRRQPLARIA